MKVIEENRQADVPLRGPRQAAKRAVKRIRRGRLDERGLTTLEWLLIVAAVAGLAALAVVLVQNVVDDTAEQISNSSARGTAAQVAAERISREARAALPTAAQRTAAVAAAGTQATQDATDAIITAQTNVNAKYGPACDRIKINYGDIEGLTVKWTPAELAVPATNNNFRIVAAIGSAGTLRDRNQGEANAQTGDAFTEARCTVSLGNS